jgi:hypothetical protein
MWTGNHLTRIPAYNSVQATLRHLSGRLIIVSLPFFLPYSFIPLNPQGRLHAKRYVQP